MKAPTFFPAGGAPLAPALVLFSMLGMAASASAANYTVDRGTDAGSYSTGVGAGLAGDLRYCLVQANANPGSVITIGQSVFLNQALPLITVNVVIQGPPGTPATIDAQGNGRIFFIDSNGEGVYLSDLELKNGVAWGGTGGGGATAGSVGGGAGGGGAAMGGAIFVNSGNLIATRLAFTTNAAVGGSGGTLSGGDHNSGGGGGGAGHGRDTAKGGSYGGGGGGLRGQGGAGNGNGDSMFAGGGGGGLLGKGGDAPTDAAGGGGGGAIGDGGNSSDHTGGTGGSGGGGAGANFNGTGQNGGTNGGGGAGGGSNGGTTDAGHGGRFGGGGAARGIGGNGGDFGGGGFGNQGGAGGFGGGGGGGGSQGGSGGFGGGGGGVGTFFGSGAGNGGSYGGKGDTSRGGGGAALGGAVFVRGGTFWLYDCPSPVPGALTGGTGGTNSLPAAANGKTAGAEYFLYGGETNFVTNSDATISFAIPGVGATVRKQGNAKLTLTGANSYGTQTNVLAGALQIGDGGTSGSITGNISTDASLIFNRSDDVAFPGAIVGSGSLTKLGAGTLTLSGVNTYSGGTTVSGGTVKLAGATYNMVYTTLSLGPGTTLNAANTANNAHTLSSLSLNGGSLRASGAESPTGWGSSTITTYGNFILNLATVSVTQTTATPSEIGNAVVQLRGVATFDVGSDASLTEDASSTLTNADYNPATSSYGSVGGLTKQGAGTLVLNGANTYTGPTTISAGTLTAGNLAALGSGPVAVGNGATLTGAVSLNGLLSVASGGLVKLSAGTLSAKAGLINNGVIRVAQGAALAVTGGPFTNNGVLDVMTGSFTAADGFTNNGVVYDSSVIRAESISYGGAGNPVSITIAGYPGHSYRLLKSADLSAPFAPADLPDQSVAENTTSNPPPSPTVLTFIDASPTADKGFYRIVVDP